MEEKKPEKKIEEKSNTFAEGIEIIPTKEEDIKEQENREIKNENLQKIIEVETETKEEIKPIQEIDINKIPQKNQHEETPKEKKKKRKKEIKKEKPPKTNLEKSNLEMNKEIQGFVKEQDPSAKGEKGKKLNPLIKTVRTYQSDIAGILKSKKTSVTKMVMAENKKKGRKGISNLPKKRKVGDFKTLIISIIVLTIVATGGYFFLNNQNLEPKIIKEIKIPTIIFPNYQQEIFLKNLKKRNIIKKIKEEELNISIPLGSIIQLFFTKKDSNKEYIIEQTDGFKILVTTEVFLNSLKTKASNSLTRALDPNFIFGYHSSLGNNPFLLFKVKSYENAYAGMLEWEKNMYNDLSDFFKKENPISVGKTRNFKDIIISNKDVRAILNEEGKIEFAYSFPDKNTLVIVNNKTTLQEIFRRVVTAGLERKN